jgi:hypothetical protein
MMALAVGNWYFFELAAVTLGDALPYVIIISGTV